MRYPPHFVRAALRAVRLPLVELGIIVRIGQLKRKEYHDTHIALVQQQYSRMVNVNK